MKKIIRRTKDAKNISDKHLNGKDFQNTWTVSNLENVSSNFI
jgi:hypothetical protein